MHGTVVSTTLLALHAWFGHATASAYSNVADSSQFLEQLGLTSAEESRLSKSLGGVDLDKVSTLDPAERGSITCLVANVVFGSKFVSQSATDYEDLVEVNW